MAWQSIHRHARIAPRKVRLVADLIRGRHCDDALAVLKFSHKRAARFVEKVLRAAMASANEQSAAMKQLVVAEARIDEGPMIKRFKAKDRGRAHPIMKRNSHIVVAVDERE